MQSALHLNAALARLLISSTIVGLVSLHRWMPSNRFRFHSPHRLAGREYVIKVQMRIAERWADKFAAQIDHLNGRQITTLSLILLREVRGRMR